MVIFLAAAAAAFSIFDLVPAAAFVVGSEAAVSAFIKNQVAEGVRLRYGEPRRVDWTAEQELDELTATLLSSRVPRSHLEVKRTDAKGDGLFATAPIAKGDHIVQYTGQIVDGTTAIDSEYAISTCSAAGDPFYIDGSDPSRSDLGRYMNHAPLGTPANNCACVRGAYSRATMREPPALHIFARRDIKAGEELQWDYGADYWSKRGGAPSG